MKVRVTSADRRWLQQGLQRYGDFAQPWRVEASGSEGCGADARDGLWTLRYEIRGDAPLSSEALRQGRVHGLHAGPGSIWTGQGFEARFCRLTRRVDMAGPSAIFPLDLVLQALWYASRPDSLIVHAAALEDGHRGWLCAGPSGSGKSTLVSLCPDHAIGDELVAVEVADSGFDLVALPFWRARPGRHPLTDVCCLVHRARGSMPPHSRRRLKPSEALARLRGQVSWPTWDTAAMVRCLDVLGRLVESMPVDELAFTPQPDVWQFLAADLGSTGSRSTNPGSAGP